MRYRIELSNADSERAVAWLEHFALIHPLHIAEILEVNWKDYTTKGKCRPELLLRDPGSRQADTIPPCVVLNLNYNRDCSSRLADGIIGFEI